MYQFYGKINRGQVSHLLQRGCPLFEGSVIRGFTVPLHKGNRKKETHTKPQAIHVQQSHRRGSPWDPYNQQSHFPHGLAMQSLGHQTTQVSLSLLFNFSSADHCDNQPLVHLPVPIRTSFILSLANFPHIFLVHFHQNFISQFFKVSILHPLIVIGSAIDNPVVV